MFVVRLLPVLALGVLLVGCSNVPLEAAPTGSPLPAPAPRFEPLGWGETYTYADGSTMSIAAPTEWESPVMTDEDMDGIDDNPDDTDPRRMVKVAFTYTNHTPQPISGVALGTLNAFVAIDTVPAEEVQPENYLELRSFGGVPILPGRSGVVETVWLAPPGEFTMTAGWTHPSGEQAIFEGKVGADPAPVTPTSDTTDAEPASVDADGDGICNSSADQYSGDCAPDCADPETDPSLCDGTDAGLDMPENDPNFVPEPCDSPDDYSCTPQTITPESSGEVQYDYFCNPDSPGYAPEYC